MRSNRFAKWVLVAPPHVLGLLKNELSPELTKHLMTTVAKDYTHLGPEELVAHLHDAVRIPPDQRDVVREKTKHSH